MIPATQKSEPFPLSAMTGLRANFASGTHVYLAGNSCRDLPPLAANLQPGTLSVTGRMQRRYPPVYDQLASDPVVPPKTGAPKIACAAKFGQSNSIGAFFGGGTVANFLGGNTVSSILNLGLAAIGNGPAPDPQRTYMNGPAFGIPINDALRLANKPTINGIGSVSGFVRGNALQGLFRAATGPAAITSIAQGGEIALQGGITAAEYASGAAVLKFGFDTATVAYGYFFDPECQ